MNKFKTPDKEKNKLKNSLKKLHIKTKKINLSMMTMIKSMMNIIKKTYKTMMFFKQKNQ